MKVVPPLTLALPLLLVPRKVTAATCSCCCGLGSSTRCSPSETTSLVTLASLKLSCQVTPKQSSERSSRQVWHRTLSHLAPLAQTQGLGELQSRASIRPSSKPPQLKSGWSSPSFGSLGWGEEREDTQAAGPPPLPYKPGPVLVTAHGQGIKMWKEPWQCLPLVRYMVEAPNS